MPENPADLTEIKQRAARVRLLVLDVDGVLTDGTLVFDAKGNECKVFLAHDGYGIRRVLQAGIQVAIISGRKSLPVQKRADDLGIEHVFLGVKDKPAVLTELLSKLGLTFETTACVGDDVPDLGCLQQAGLAIAVANAHSSLDAVADWRTTKSGGQGAVREVCDLLLDAAGT